MIGKGGEQQIEVASKNKPGRKFLSSIVVFLLIGTGLMVAGPAASAPVIINEDSGGSWGDNFTDTLGIETWDNLRLWENGVALDNYTLLFDDFTGTNGDPPDSGIWTLWDDGWDLDIQSNTLHSYADPPSPTWAFEMVENKNPLSMPHTITWRQQVHTVSTGMYAHFFIIKASDDSFMLNFDQNNAGQYNIYNYISTGGALLGMGISGWHDYKITYDNGYVDVYYDGDVKHSYDFGPIPVKYRIGTYMQLTASTIYTDDVLITANYTTGNMTSTEIILPAGQAWESLTVNKSEFGQENIINVTILDGATYQPILGFENLTGSDIDITGIDEVMYPTIRLRAHFYSDGNPSPVLHDWNVTWADTIPPITPTGFKVNNPFNGYSLVLSWNPNQEPDNEYYLLYYSLDNITFYRLTSLDNNTLFYTHYGLTKGTTYYYKIAAGDEIPNQSPFSEVIEGIPDMDYDGDGIGDIPDPDDDNDGTPDFSDPYPLNPLNDLETRIIDIQTILANFNLTDLTNTIKYLNQTLPLKIDDLSTQLTAVNDSLMTRITQLESNILSDLQSVNASLYSEIQNLLSEITSDILEMMTSLEMLEANLTAQHDSLNSSIDILSDLVESEHALTRSEILDMLNNSLDMLQTLDTNMTAHDTDIKNLITALDDLVKNENNLTRDQLIDNATEILNQLQIVDQNILDAISGLNTSTSAQLTNLLNNMTAEHENLEQWLDIVLDGIEYDLAAANETLHKQLSDLDASMTSFFYNLNSDISDIRSGLIEHDKKSGQNHSDIIGLLDDLLAGQIEKEKIHELRTFLINLAGNLSGHNQTIADDIMDVVEDIDKFEVETDTQLERINKTLEDLAKLEQILGDLQALDQSLEQAEEEIQDSIDERSTKEEDEERFVMLELFLIIVLILLVINMILTLMTRKKIDSMRDSRASMAMKEEDREVDFSTPEPVEEGTGRTPPRPPSTE